MKGRSIFVIASFLLLIAIQNSLARPMERNQSSGNPNEGESSVKHTDVTTEEHILKGDIEPIDDRKIGDAIFDVLSQNPDHVSQIDVYTDKTTTFREMKDRSVRLAIWMKKLDIKPSDIITECSHNHLDTYTPLFATLFVDAIFSAWESNIHLHKARFLMKTYTPKLIFTNEETADVLLEAAKLENKDVKLIVFGMHSSLQSLSEILNSQTEEEVSNFAIVNEKKSNEVSVIMLSSGTTGDPKGIMLSSKSVYWRGSRDQSINSLDSTRVVWNSMINWISGFRQALQTILQKKTRIIGELSDETKLLQTIEKYKVNIVALPLYLINSIATSDSIRNYNLESFKYIMLSGFKLNRNIISGLKQRLPGVFILYAYATTESGTISLTSSKSTDLESVGFVAPNVQVKFIDHALGKDLGPNKSGEIYVKSPSMMIGYYKNPEKTQEVLDSDGWYHTGDLGYYHENGEIFISDRISEIIKYKDYQISPSRIELIVFTHPGVEEIAIVSIPHQSDGDLPIVFIKKVPGSRVTKKEILGILHTFEAFREIHGGIYFLDKFPRLANGKISKTELKQLAIDYSKNPETES